MLNYVRQFFKIRVVFRALYLLNEVGDSHFFLHFWHKLLIIWLQQQLKKNLSTAKVLRERP